MKRAPPLVGTRGPRWQGNDRKPDAPKAVVDLNQDGVPEVVVHTDDGPIFGDLVYGFRQVGGWQVVARGVPGSTA
jgi:hypothetical protein